jgi:hypothetical protein
LRPGPRNAGAEQQGQQERGYTGSLEKALNQTRHDFMWLLFLEAGLALGLLVFIVWWTMFSGRKDDDD